MKPEIKSSKNFKQNTVQKTKLTEAFYQNDLQIPIDSKKKAQTLLFLQQEIEHKEIIPFASNREIIRAQMQLLDYKIMALQILCFMVLLFLYWILRNTMNEKIIYIPMTASAPLFCMLMMIDCNREETLGLAELTGSCFFNHRQICALRMILYGIGNLLFITAASLLLCNTVQRSAVEIATYFLIPFLMTGCVQFMILLMGWGRKNNYSLIAVGLLMTVLWIQVSTHSEIYEHTALRIWVFILLLCAAVYSIEATVMLKQMERGNLLCRN